MKAWIRSVQCTHMWDGWVTCERSGATLWCRVLSFISLLFRPAQPILLWMGRKLPLSKQLSTQLFLASAGTLKASADVNSLEQSDWPASSGAAWNEQTSSNASQATGASFAPQRRPSGPLMWGVHCTSQWNHFRDFLCASLHLCVECVFTLTWIFGTWYFSD